MKKLIIFCLIFSKCFCQTIIVHSKTDKRYLDYQDSLRSYVSGLKQLLIAIRVKNKKDTTEGHAAMHVINKMRVHLNPNIKFVLLFRNYSFYYQQTIENGTTYNVYWIPELYKKPVRIIYEPLPIQKLVAINKSIKKRFSKPIKLPIDTIKKHLHYYYYTINGKQVNREQFEKFFGRKTL